jgi:hypothetical protein
MRSTTDILIIFLAYFPYFEKIKVGLKDPVAVCVCIPLIVARQRLDKKSPYRC